ncbi:MAG: hypothetical protein RIQ90_1087 [Bacteroidota bacterium]|jgi:uncharacterized protein (DUF1800 family)
MASLNPITGVLGKQKAAHLLRRATMGPRLQDITAFSLLDVDAAIAQLIQPQTPPNFPVDPNTGTTWIAPNLPDPTQMVDVWSGYTKSWWLETMRSSGPNLTERMVWFYHTHIPIILSRVSWSPQLAIDYLRLLRTHALGNYKDLVKAICIDNAMLIHLDGHLNVKGAPQENFGREFLELFTVGKGPEVSLGNYTHFTEQDVKALTKVLTGWTYDTTFQTLDPVTGIPCGKVKSGDGVLASQHDVSAKQFSSAFGGNTIVTAGASNGTCPVSSVPSELSSVVDMVFNSVHTARHICRRLYRQFVYFDISAEIETDIIIPLANALLANNYDLIDVLSTLLKSEHFYDLDTLPTQDNNMGAIIKSPVEIIIGTMRLFNVQVPSATTQLSQHYELFDQLQTQLDLQGLALFEPVDVAGYDPYFQVPVYHRYWISANYLANRYKFAELLVNGFTSPAGATIQLDVLSVVQGNASTPSDPDLLVQEIVEWLLPLTIDTARLTYFKDSLLLNNNSLNWSAEWAAFQGSGNDAVVRVQLEKLFIGMMQTPEYQLF